MSVTYHIHPYTGMWNFLFTYTFKIMEYVQDTVLLKQKKQPVLDIIGFFFHMSTQVKAEVRSEYECGKRNLFSPIIMAF